MIIFFAIVFFLSAALVFHSYVLYPFILQVLNGKKENNNVVFNEAELPEVIILMSVFNEQTVIQQKLKSILTTTYPLQKLRVWIGSDNSTDATNGIIKSFAEKQSIIRLFEFKERNGKSGVLNKLRIRLQQEYTPVQLENTILILTDANVFFQPKTITALVKHFKNEAIAQVGANIHNNGLQEDGISVQEKDYIQRENKIKYLEGLSGVMQGAFGACYALRASYFPEIPANFLMEDFYISMHILKERKNAIFELNAVCTEDVSNEVGEEFKRKTRISAGNFQNLGVYWTLLLRFDFNSFCFFSHKVLRWITPLLILICLLSSFELARFTLFKAFVFIQLLLMTTPFVDLLLKRMGVHFKALRLIAYFYTMNFALVNGFKIYAKGVKTNAWTPTKRTI